MTDITEDDWIKVARRLAAGEITEDEARAVLRALCDDDEVDE